MFAKNEKVEVTEMSRRGGYGFRVARVVKQSDDGFVKVRFETGETAWKRCDYVSHGRNPWR